MHNTFVFFSSASVSFTDPFATYCYAIKFCDINKLQALFGSASFKVAVQSDEIDGEYS